MVNKILGKKNQTWTKKERNSPTGICQNQGKENGRGAFGKGRALRVDTRYPSRGTKMKNGKQEKAILLKRDYKGKKAQPNSPSQNAEQRTKTEPSNSMGTMRLFKMKKKKKSSPKGRKGGVGVRKKQKN